MSVSALLCGAKRTPFPQVKVLRCSAWVCYMTDVDPPRYEARHATSWLVLFMTHVASCGAGAVIKSSQEPGQSYIDSSDPEFRQKVATRLGMARHPDDVAAIRSTREATEKAAAEAAHS